MAADSREEQSLQTLPPAPPPSATHSEVQVFLTDYLHCSMPHRSRSDMIDLARKINANGEQIYEMPLQMWTDELGLTGYFIYNSLQKSSYGYFSMRAISRFFTRLSCFSLSSGFAVGQSRSRKVKPQPLQSQAYSSPLLEPSSSLVYSAKELPSLDGSDFLNNSNFEIPALGQDVGKFGQDNQNQHKNTLRSRRHFSKDAD